MGGELHGELQHVLAEERHPRRAVRLFEVAAGRQRGAAVEDADVVEAEEAALEHVLAEAVLAVDPPGEVQQELVEGRPEELHVRFAAQRLLGAVEEQGRKGVDRRIDVAEVPLVRGHLTVGVQVEPRSISSICSLAKSGSTIESGSVWKARSHAAYQGYSHLSGMEMMSWFSMWNHSEFRAL